MKSTIIFFIGLFLGLGTAQAQVRNVDLGISVSNGRLQDFYLAIGDHYRVPPREVVEIREHYGCPEEDLPVIYFLADRAHVKPAAIISLRVRRMSWFDIAFHYRLTPDIFFVPVSAQRIGPPYGNAYGYYRKYGSGGNWKKGMLSDREVVDLVNLKFMSEHYRMPAEKIMAMRGGESHFTVINERISKEKGNGKPEKQNQNKQNQNGRGKNKKTR